MPKQKRKSELRNDIMLLLFNKERFASKLCTQTCLMLTCRLSTIPENSSASFIDLEAEHSEHDDEVQPGDVFNIDRSFNEGALQSFVENQLTSFIKKKYDMPVLWQSAVPFKETTTLVIVPEDKLSQQNRKTNPVMHDAVTRLGGSNFLVSVWKLVVTTKTDDKGVERSKESWKQYEGTCWMGLWVEKTISNVNGCFFSVCLDIEDIESKKSTVKTLTVTKYPLVTVLGFDGLS